jgi:hypothetical protein
MPDDVCRSRQRLPRNRVDDEFPGLEVAQRMPTDEAARAGDQDSLAYSWLLRRRDCRLRDTQRRRAYALKATLLNAHHADSAAQSGNRRSGSEMTDTGNGHFT